jgi:triosephosphate isomerase
MEVLDSTIGWQGMAVLDGVEPGQLKSFAVAYEPLWAIGTGKTAAAEDVQRMHGHIRKILERYIGKEDGQRIPILYGGSVKSSNASDLLAQRDVDGALVGGASLNADEFLAIAARAREL